jgi:SAM-dependent methyltransferase
MSPHPDAHPYSCGRLGAKDALRPGGPDLSRYAIARAGFAPGQRVLDLGCGSGASAALLHEHGCRCCGVDPARPALDAAARAHPGPGWVQADGEHLPFADGCMDGILAECSLSVMPDRHRALRECRRVLAVGAPLLLTDVYARAPEVTVYAAGELPACLGDMPGRDSLLDDIEAAGFGIELWEDHSSVLKPFLARVIFEQGSLDALWSSAGTSATPAALSCALLAKRPGYCLVLARAEATARNH